MSTVDPSKVKLAGVTEESLKLMEAVVQAPVALQQPARCLHSKPAEEVARNAGKKARPASGSKRQLTHAQLDYHRPLQPEEHNLLLQKLLATFEEEVSTVVNVANHRPTPDIIAVARFVTQHWQHSIRHCAQTDLNKKPVVNGSRILQGNATWLIAHVE